VFCAVKTCLIKFLHNLVTLLLNYGEKPGRKAEDKDVGDLR
jgi:hypothetical protein